MTPTTEPWQIEPRPVPDGLENPELNERLSVLRGFTVAEHLDDRDRDALLDFAKRVV